MELGNLLFGHSRGKYPLKYREKIQDCEEWKHLLEMINTDSYGNCLVSQGRNKHHGFSCELFEINPYYWGDCDCGADKKIEKLISCKEYKKADEIQHSSNCSLCIPNFIYYGENETFKLKWYKYPFRDSYMNMDLTYDEFIQILKNCIEFISNSKDNSTSEK